ncbi:hypothetical protein ABID58_000871 [Bradyrhizobium sp. S3.2.6]
MDASGRDFGELGSDTKIAPITRAIFVLEATRSAWRRLASSSTVMVRPFVAASG